MRSATDTNVFSATRPRHYGWTFAFWIVLVVFAASRVNAQTFNSESDGSDGPLDINTFFPGGDVPQTCPLTVSFDPSKFHGSQVSANILNFTTITIPPCLVVRLTADKISGPVVWRAQGDVHIEGTVDLRGSPGAFSTSNPFARVPAIAGAGGYSGGIAGNGIQTAASGDGPGGGAGATSCDPPWGQGGTFSGNSFLLPLIGGSGGGGGSRCPNFGEGGGAGGGAFVLASSTHITLGPFTNGYGGINANGGMAPGYAGGGSGGAIRLVSTAITLNTPVISANGGASCYTSGGAGIIRIEAFNVSGQLNSGRFGSESSACDLFGQRSSAITTSPFPLILAAHPTAAVISIGGVLINPNPNTFPDITINTAAAVPVVIQTRNIPATATIKLTILNQNNVPDTVIEAPPLGNCDADNVCTTTVNVIFPFGPSRGLTKVTWMP
jgi:hypothetical protein